MSRQISITLPDVLALNDRGTGNQIRQLAERGKTIQGHYVPGKRRRVFRPVDDGSDILEIPKHGHVPATDERVIRASNGSSAVWIRHPRMRDPRTFSYPEEIEAVLKSWRGAFSYVEEDRSRNVKGLRKPQIGAVHAVHAHWATSNEPATIVMPTGTGKTDTMIAILVSALCEKVAVVVPTDALRTQIARKFMTLGVLKEQGCAVLRSEARYPIVAVLDHIPKSVQQVDEIFGRAQVIIMTSAIAGQAKEAVQKRMAHHCPYLFIDEAHHIEAPTWSAFRSRFADRRILQFTATPFREDGKLLDGRIIFRYPLRKAQEEGYFRPIRFEPVREFIPGAADEAIAKKAIERLRAERAMGHILMARVDSVERAKKVFEIYKRHREFHPVQLHSGIHSKREREAARQNILSGQSRIVVCVDMLGEGFDLPELKIAAFHDIRKTLAVTLQLAGRFVRQRKGLGNATFIANVADIDVQGELRALYTHDPDWNALLPKLSSELISSQMSLQEFLRGFTVFPGEIPLKTVRPAMSTVVYRTARPDWTPEEFRRGIPHIDDCEQVHYAVNQKENVLVIVAARRVPLPWTGAETLFNWDWELYVVFWSREQNLLFINCSANAGDYGKLARAVAGPDVQLIKDDSVFRAFSGISRLRLQNVGLTEELGRNVRYTGRMGADVEAALSEVLRRGGRKSVLAGSGYENGDVATIGASRRGRIWSHRRKPVDGLIQWCRRIGDKLLDESIDPEQILRGTLRPRPVTKRPNVMPMYADWPEEMYRSLEGEWWIAFGGREWHLSELSLHLVEPSTDKPLTMAIASESDCVKLSLALFERELAPSASPRPGAQTLVPDYRFDLLGRGEVRIRRGKHGESIPIADFFHDTPPMIWFVDGSSLEGNQLVELRKKREPYPASKIEPWIWRGTNLKKESQGREKDPRSIQARVIRKLKAANKYHLIFDDDDSGELADVVAVRVIERRGVAPKRIEVELYHCKYSSEPDPGRRIGDLYELCGQAQKCISWMTKPERQVEIFKHLARREATRLESEKERLRKQRKSIKLAEKATRFERGTMNDLQKLESISQLHPMALKVCIVQPGLSRRNATDDQLEILSVTENHLAETYQLPFRVIGSD